MKCKIVATGTRKLKSNREDQAVRLGRGLVLHGVFHGVFFFFSLVGVKH